MDEDSMLFVSHTVHFGDLQVPPAVSSMQLRLPMSLRIAFS